MRRARVETLTENYVVGGTIGTFDASGQFCPMFLCGQDLDFSEVRIGEGASPSTAGLGAVEPTGSGNSSKFAIPASLIPVASDRSSGAPAQGAVESPVHPTTGEDAKQDAAKRKKLTVYLALKVSDALVGLAEILLGLSVALAFRFKLLSEDFEASLEEFRLCYPEDPLYRALHRFPKLAHRASRDLKESLS